MYYRKALIAAAGAIALPLAAAAQPVTGPYISLGAGMDYLQNQTHHGDSAVALRSDAKYDIGGIASGAVGYGLGNGLRFEIQGDWSSEKFYNGGSNYIQQYHGFVNGFYDLDGALFGLAWLNPYVGAGAGYGVTHLTNLNVGGIDAKGSTYLVHSTGTNDNFAVQGIAGIAFETGVPGLALTAEYRFITMPTDSDYNSQYFDGSVYGRLHIKTDGEYNHIGMLGLRYALFQPPPPAAAPPPPPVAPAPQPARTYLVFFDWDRADLTSRARQIIAEAAQASTHVQTTRIDVNGYTDLSGTAAYNQHLSVRRAKSVEAELVRDGVPAGEISIRGYGESNPLVPTAKGVREPQNRRVEIILH